MQVKSPERHIENADLTVYHCGQEDCAPGHSYGPAVRDHFLIHYISSGRGTFQVGDEVHVLGKNQGFLIYPDSVTTYQADLDDPWHYAWVGFWGVKAGSFLRQAGFTVDDPVFTYDRDDRLRDCLAQMVAARGLAKKPVSRDMRLLGLLYHFLSLLVEVNGSEYLPDEKGGRTESYVRKAIAYVEMNYSHKISVAEIAEHVALNRSYFGAIFRERTGVAPQQFLIDFRVNRACALLRNDVLSIGDIARSVGYADPLLFSKMFKKIKGVSPSKYREQGDLENPCA